MEMKNKLIKHHKNSAHFYFHDLGIVIAFVVGFVALVTVPTYISVVMTKKSQAKGTEEQVVETSTNSEELLEY